MDINGIKRVEKLMEKVRRCKSYQKIDSHRELSCGVGYYEGNHLESVEDAYFILKYNGVEFTHKSGLRNTCGGFELDVLYSTGEILPLDFNGWLDKIEAKLDEELEQNLEITITINGRQYKAI